MLNNITHFAINADDCQRALDFYTTVFGWRFEPWGPPEFWRIFTHLGIHGALQKRTEPVSGTGMTGYECTIGVEDVKATVVSIEAAGGTIVYPPFTIEGVGIVAKFQDTEGNQACVMEYLEGVG